MKKIYIYFLTIFLALICPSLTFADGGMMIWPPSVHLDQSAQNAIVAWNKNEEKIMLSINIESSGSSTVLRVIPLPSNPSEIIEGEFESFEKLVEIMNEKIDDVRDGHLGAPAEWKNQAASGGVEITFQEKIGAHDITVVKVNDLDCFLDWVENFAEEKGLQKTDLEIECEKYHYSTCPESCIKTCTPSVCSPEGECTADCDGVGSCRNKIQKKEISSEFKEGVENYLKKDIKYFVFDVIEAGQEKESIKPLIYNFKTDYLYFPILISGISEISESRTEINLFLVTEEETEFANVPYGYHRSNWFNHYGYPVELTKEELEEVSIEIADLFEDGASVRKTSVYAKLKDLDRDLMLFPSSFWDDGLAMGNTGREIKAMQQMLINEGLWNSNVGATGYFGTITKTALSEFQDTYLKSKTGSFDSETKDYFKSLAVSVQQAEQKVKNFGRDLAIGMSGEDVKMLQEILIEEGVWERPDIAATGYFGPVTKAAVIRYQEKHFSDVLKPVNLTKGTGFVGASTRAQLGKSN